ncbi:hypothetical protein HZS_6556, partial [Henneguya salminicola]
MNSENIHDSNDVRNYYFQDDKKRVHNDLERKRRENIKDNFDSLSESLPVDRHDKSCRYSILSSTHKFIKKTKKVIEETKIRQKKCHENFMRIEKEIARLEKARLMNMDVTPDPEIVKLLKETTVPSFLSVN